MADTVSLVRDIYPNVLKQVSHIIEIALKEKQFMIGEPKRGKKFNGISYDNKTIVSIFTSSGYSISGNMPEGKINKVYATCYMMNLTKAERKILAFTDSEFYEIIKRRTEGFLPGFELMNIELPEELKHLAKTVNKKASEEMA